MKRALLFNDISGIGGCSLYADLSVLSAMGVRSVPVLTAALTRQTDYDTYTEVREPVPFEAYRKDYQATDERFDGILTGYIGAPDKIRKILPFVKEFHGAGTCLLVDPVMGDHGTGYDLMSDDYLAAVRSLMAEADLSTPNLTEFCLLTDTPYSVFENASLEEIEQTVLDLWRKMPRREGSRMVVTGAISHGQVANLVLENDTAAAFSSPHMDQDFSGTGDLFASVILGSILLGDTLENGVSLATEFLYKAVRMSISMGLTSREGTAFEGCLSILTKESGKVSTK